MLSSIATVRRGAALCLTLATTVGPNAARAAELATQSERVSFADLNLASDAGRATLHTRIGAAIRNVCGPVERDLSAALDRAACVADVTAQARATEHRVLAEAALHQPTRLAASGKY